jgi:DNA ligase-1
VLITGIRKREFGFLLGFLDGRPAWGMELMPPAEQKSLYQMRKVVSEDNKFTFIEPIPCRAKYRHLTKAGLLRIPSFLKWN